MTASMWLRRQLISQKQAKSGSDSGFTLLELLIALLIGSIILSGLVFLVTEMLKIERREIAIEQTQRDMKRALEYIADDVAEAIYLYTPDNTGDWPAAIDQFAGDLVNGDTDNLALAFWRPDFVADSNLPTTAACGQNDQDCRNLAERRAFYTFVMYEVVPNDGAGIWEGQARIIRHELPKYRGNNFNNAVYAGDGPINDDGDFIFEDWTAAAGPAGLNFTSAVLVDYVANPADPAIPDTGLECRQQFGLIRVPVTEVESKSFFACIREAQAAGANNRDNQNLEIFLRGDYEPRDGRNDALGFDVASSDSLLPALQTGVFVQGVINYNPD